MIVPQFSTKILNYPFHLLLFLHFDITTSFALGLVMVCLTNSTYLVTLLGKCESMLALVHQT